MSDVAPAGTAADRFAAARARVHALLPARWQRWLPATAIGFAALSGFTYAVDLILLALLFNVASPTRWP